MGTDIHVRVETRDYGRWQKVAQFRMGRSYRLFGLMAGVQDPYIALFTPRGFPEDVSVWLRQEFDDAGYHSISYLSIQEVERVNNEYVRQFGPAPAGLLAVYGAMKGYLVGGAEDVRIVFGFDS